MDLGLFHPAWRAEPNSISKRIIPARQSMPEITHNDQLREEFNRWAEAGRGEGMERDHLPIVLPMLAKMGICADENILDVGCGSRLALQTSRATRHRRTRRRCGHLR